MQDLIAVAVGNTRTRIGRFRGKDLLDPASLINAQPDALINAISLLAQSDPDLPVVLASVNDPFAHAINQRLADRHLLRIGTDLPFPGNHALDDASTVGHDRILNAIGAFSRAAQACIIIDAGTAITVDFVDGEGTFHGGVIAPGLHMMLRSLHEHTSALPLVDLHRPDAARGVFGKDTRHAVMLGVINAAQGLARLMIEKYAEFYRAYPQVIATGGDAHLLFEDDEVVEHIVPDLQLLGIREAFLRSQDSDRGHQA